MHVRRHRRKHEHKPAGDVFLTSAHRHRHTVGAVHRRACGERNPSGEMQEGRDASVIKLVYLVEGGRVGSQGAAADRG